jgi:hypothetical protein
MTKETISTIGLVLDLVGVLLLFKYGLPSDISKDGVTTLSIGTTNNKEIKKWKKYNLWSKIGLGFIFIGFILQIISNYV